MTTPPRPTGLDPEDDPTGVRALLSSLPDPGPMPPDLVERIGASLAAQQNDRARSQPADPTVVPLRSRRLGSRILGAVAAAAAVAAVGVVGVNLFQTAIRPSADTAASGSAAMTGSRAQEGDAGGGQERPLSEAGEKLRIQMSGRHYTPTALAADAGRLLLAQDAPVRDLAAEAPSLGPIATSVGLASCISALGASDAERVVADLAYYEDQPVAVVVAVRDGSRTAYVVGRQCSSSGPALVTQVPLP